MPSHAASENLSTFWIFRNYKDDSEFIDEDEILTKHPDFQIEWFHSSKIDFSKSKAESQRRDWNDPQNSGKISIFYFSLLVKIVSYITYNLNAQVPK